jgi:hypothetical protein
MTLSLLFLLLLTSWLSLVVVLVELQAVAVLVDTERALGHQEQIQALSPNSLWLYQLTTP